jgi:hypothetical protein
MPDFLMMSDTWKHVGVLEYIDKSCVVVGVIKVISNYKLIL